MKVSKPERSFPNRVAGIWGGLEESLRAADDPETAMADFFQVTLSQLEAWRAAEGRHRCPGVTTRGHGCRNFTSAVVDYDPRLWVSRDTAYCPTHMKSQPGPAGMRAGVSAPALNIVGRNAATEDDASVTAR